jgi:hypothetical protein
MKKKETLDISIYQLYNALNKNILDKNVYEFVIKKKIQLEFK